MLFFLFELVFVLLEEKKLSKRATKRRLELCSGRNHSSLCMHLLVTYHCIHMAYVSQHYVTR